MLLHSMHVKGCHVGLGKTKLDLCSLGPSVQHTSKFKLTQPIFNAPKMEASERYHTCYPKLLKVAELT